MSMDVNDDDHGLEYAQHVYANVIDWYRSAEGKAQIILTLDGVFLGLLAFPRELRDAADTFGPATWALFAAAVISLGGSILCAVMTLVSRHARGSRLSGESPSPSYHPASMWFFATISELDRGRFRSVAGAADPTFEKEALLDQVWVLSGNVLAKHRWVNRAFVLTGLTLVFFAAASAAYVV